MKILPMIYDFKLKFRILHCINAGQNVIKIKVNIKIKLPGNVTRS